MALASLQKRPLRTLCICAGMSVLLSSCRSPWRDAEAGSSPSPEVEEVPAVEDLLSRLNSADWQERREAVGRLGGGSADSARAFGELRRILETDPVVSVRVAAARSLGELRNPQAVEPLAQALSDPSDDVRGEATVALGKLGSLASPAIPALVEGLRSENMDEFPRCMGGAAGALARIGAEAVPALVAAAGNRARYSLVEQALADMGPSALPILEDMLASGGDQTTTAAIAVRLLGAEAGPAVPAVVAASRANNIDTEAFAYEMYVLGPTARAAVPRLLELLKDPEAARQRCSVATALKRINDGRTAVLGALEEAAESETEPTQRSCLIEAARSLDARRGLDQ